MKDEGTSAFLEEFLHIIKMQKMLILGVCFGMGATPLNSDPN